jgi:hypothetical protein
MTETASIAIWNTLQDFGFAPDESVMSDVRPGLSFDFGNFTLCASAVMGKWFQPVVLFTGVLTTPRTMAEICFEIPRSPMAKELVAAWIVWHLDRNSDSGRFTPKREPDWLELGRQNQHQLPWEIARAAYAARPHCTVNRAVLRLALNTLAKNLMEADASAPVIVAFDGRVLSFLCCGVETLMGATGEAWPHQYCALAKTLRERLPKRLMRPLVEVGVWESRLRIGRCLYDADEIKTPPAVAC